MINIFIKASKNGSRDDPAAVLISIVITTGYKKNGIPSSGENKVEIGRARLFLAMTICRALPGMTTVLYSQMAVGMIRLPFFYMLSKSLNMKSAQ